MMYLVNFAMYDWEDCTPYSVCHTKEAAESLCAKLRVRDPRMADEVEYRPWASITPIPLYESEEE